MTDGNGAECPICGKPRTEKYRPFCSARCADVDLNRWLSGRYAIPVVEEDGAEDVAGDGPAETAGQQRNESL